MKNFLDARICKDENNKFYVDFYHDDKLFCTNAGGELSLILENEDRSIRHDIDGFKADTAESCGDIIKLCGKVYLDDLTAYLTISISYRRVNDLCFEKLVELKQTNIPVLFFSLKTSLTGADCSHLWSFDNANHKGGIAHGTYPAIGFTNKSGISGGILTDAGHRNMWTRNLRRRPTPGNIGFTAINRLCDGQLLTLRDNTATLQLGLLNDYNHGERKTVASPAESDVFAMANTVKEGLKFSGSGEAGGYFPYLLEDGYYTFSFDYTSDSPVFARVLKKDKDSEVRGFHYQDNMPHNNGAKTHFEDSFFLSDTEGYPTLMQIFAKSADGKEGSITIENLKMVRSMGEEAAYHPLRIGKPQSRRMFIFAEQGEDIRTLRLASQLRLAEGLGFEGSDPEKVLFADMQMLTWITGETDFTPLNVPSINYAPDMYNRDAFWSVAGIDDAELSCAIFERWGDTQSNEGGICTIVTPCMGSIEVKDNEATCEWLWWAYINRKKYGYETSREKLEKAWRFCTSRFDPKGTGICEAHFVLGQNDVTTYPGDKKTSNVSVNQGVWAITLKVGKALGFDVSQQRIESAVNSYRSFYDKERGYLLNDRLFPHAISAGDLMPEFASLWLFDEPMLDDEMVVNTVSRIPHENEFGFFIGHADNRYFSKENIPCDSEFMWPDGVYYNGASWMREEVMAYAAGARHGWQDAQRRYTERLAGEINVKHDEPFSHEFIPTDLSVPNCWWPSIRVFCWNVFALTAKKVADFK